MMWYIFMLVFQNVRFCICAELDTLRQSLCLIGFEKDAIKTADFSIESAYDDQRDEDGTRRRVFAGYQVEHELTLAFPLDMKKLDAVISVLADSLANPCVYIAFTIADAESAKAEILEKATKDAYEKASILCKAAQAKLGRLLSINYSWDEVSFSTGDNMKFCAPNHGMYKACTFDFQPEDIKASDTVEFIWELEEK